jgi:hypothetical protein
VKRMHLLTMAMFLVGLFLGSVALAKATSQPSSGSGESTPSGYAPFAAPVQVTTGPLVSTTGLLAPSGGPSILLAGAALLLGTGVLTCTILTRRE